jgi:hypothetical protein
MVLERTHHTVWGTDKRNTLRIPAAALVHFHGFVNADVVLKARVGSNTAATPRCRVPS